MGRVEVLKTYKLYIGGQFPRTESGRYYPLLDAKGRTIANVSLSSRKDFRNAVVAARAAQGSWAGKTAFNRSQILYRIAEMMEGRFEQFVSEIVSQGKSRKAAEEETRTAIDRVVYYAGWCDKFQALFSTVNPVASSHFNFSVPEPTGVVAIIADPKTSLIGSVSAIMPVIAGGNTCVALASESLPLCAVTLGEVLETSDLPAGIVNILTGSASELAAHFASHMDVNAVVDCSGSVERKKLIQEAAALNIKRAFFYEKDWIKPDAESPYMILDLQEIKTTWHPIENIGVGGAKY